MQIISQIFQTILLAPIVNLLILVFHLLSLAHIPGALGFSIIILTGIIRILVWPFMASQLRASKKMADLKPHLDELKTKHKDDKQAFAQAQMALYKEHGINPAGGCLPALIQIPVVIALYQSILSLFSGNIDLDKINNLLYVSSWHLTKAPDLNFFGLNLATKPIDFSHAGILLLLVPVVTAGLQLIQARMMAPLPIKEYPSDSTKEKQEKEKTDDSMAAMQAQMSFMMPLMVGYFALTFPSGLALYWNTYTILGIIQQYLISGWGGLATWLKFLKS